MLKLATSTITRLFVSCSLTQFLVVFRVVQMFSYSADTTTLFMPAARGCCRVGSDVIPHRPLSRTDRVLTKCRVKCLRGAEMIPQMDERNAPHHNASAERVVQMALYWIRSKKNLRKRRDVRCTAPSCTSNNRLGDRFSSRAASSLHNAQTSNIVSQRRFSIAAYALFDRSSPGPYIVLLSPLSPNDVFTRTRARTSHNEFCAHSPNSKPEMCQAATAATALSTQAQYF